MALLTKAADGDLSKRSELGKEFCVLSCRKLRFRLCFSFPFVRGRRKRRSKRDSQLTPCCRIVQLHGKNSGSKWEPYMYKKTYFEHLFCFFCSITRTYYNQKVFFKKSATIFPTWYLVGSLSSFFFQRRIGERGGGKSATEEERRKEKGKLSKVHSEEKWKKSLDLLCSPG